MGWALSTATVLWFGLSVQALCCGFDSQYSNCVVDCTVIIAIFGLDIQYSNFVLVWTVSTATVLCIGHTVQQLCSGLYSHYSNCVLGWTVSKATVLWAILSLQRVCFFALFRAQVWLINLF